MGIYCGKFYINTDHVLYADHCDSDGRVTFHFTNGTVFQLDEVSSEDARSEFDLGRDGQRVEDERDKLDLELSRAHLKDHDG